MNLSAFHLKAHAAQHVDVEPVVLAVGMVFASMTLHSAATAVDDVTKIAHFIGALGSAGLVIALLWQYAFGSTTKANSQAAEAAKFAPPLVKVGLSLLALLGVFALIRRRSVNVSEPMGLIAQTRKLSDDHAGDDGEVEGTTGDAPTWLDAAFKKLGLHEKLRNGKSNPLVSEFFVYAGKSRETDARNVPWCAAFVNAMLASVNIRGTGTAWARDFMKWGAPCEPRRGAIIVFRRRDSDGVDRGSGHVGFVDSVNEDGSINVLGGNQRDCVCVVKFAAEKVQNDMLGCRWPRSLLKSKTVVGSAMSLVGTTGKTLKESLPAPDVMADTVDQSRGALESIRSIMQGPYATYIDIALIVLAVGGAVLAIYGRNSVRRETGY